MTPGAYLNHRIIYNALSEMNYDANKLPLGSSHSSSRAGLFADESACREAREINNLVRVLCFERTL